MYVYVYVYIYIYIQGERERERGREKDIIGDCKLCHQSALGRSVAPGEAQTIIY